MICFWEEWQSWLELTLASWPTSRLRGGGLGFILLTCVLLIYFWLCSQSGSCCTNSMCAESMEIQQRSWVSHKPVDRAVGPSIWLFGVQKIRLWSSDLQPSVCILNTGGPQLVFFISGNRNELCGDSFNHEYPEISKMRKIFYTILILEPIYLIYSRSWILHIHCKCLLPAQVD